MIMSSIRRSNLAGPETRGGARWPWFLLAACGCMQWPSPEREDTLAAAASTSAAQSREDEARQEGPASDGVLWQTRLGSAAAPLAGASLSASDGVLFVAGAVSSETRDASLAAYSGSDGSVLWTRQLGSSESDAANASASRGARVLIAGQSSGSLGGPAQGFGDAFAAAYSATGELLWTRQLGGSEPDAALAVSLDPSGAALVVGETRSALEGARDGTDRDAFLARLAEDGELVYVRQLGSSPGLDEIATSVAAAASGDVVLAGYTFGDVQTESNGSADAFVARYSGAGDLLWTAQLGGEDYDAAEAVAVDDSGAVYVAGQTGGSVAGPGVVFGGRPLLAKYSPAGEPIWTVELEDAAMGAASAVVVDARGDIWIAGRTAASFAAPNQGAFDSFVARFSADGARSSALQLGLTDNDRADGLALDGGRLFLLTRATQSGKIAFDYALLSALDSEL